MKKFDNSLSSNPLRKHVYKEIEKAILDGVFAPGDALTEVKLSNELGVSRTPVREALMQLELEGLVKTVPNKGAVVVGVTSKDIDDIYNIRMRIEGLATRGAAENIDEDELEMLKQVVELQEFFVTKEDFLQVWQLDNRFHELIYDSCGSRPLKQILSLFHNYIQKAREYSVKSGRAAASTAEHRAILDAITAHDLDTAEAAMVLHVRNARDAFFEYME
ncbi:GntR family transcriptional regulator [Acidaminobacterium chupaoyuni]